MTPALAIGVASGLGTAGLQAVCYVASRHYTRSRDDEARAGLALIVVVHLWLAAMGAVTLPFVWTAGIRWGRVLPPLLLSTGLDLFGQAGLTVALRHAEPSRVSPLLTMKVFIPALLAVALGQPVGPAAHHPPTGWQGLAVVLCVVACLSVHRAGGRLPRAAVVALVATVLAFGTTDWFIAKAIAATLPGPAAGPAVSTLRPCVLLVAMQYLLTSVAALAVLPTRLSGLPPGRRTYPWPDWRDALPYSAAWYAAMILLLVSFAHVGVVLGTILQCTRSFLTVLLGLGLMYLGFAHIEPPQPLRIVARRVAAGLLMTLSITLYVVRDPVALLSGRPAATPTEPVPAHGAAHPNAVLADPLRSSAGERASA